MMLGLGLVLVTQHMRFTTSIEARHIELVILNIISRVSSSQMQCVR